jgi:hypothetical protein
MPLVVEEKDGPGWQDAPWCRCERGLLMSFFLLPKEPDNAYAQHPEKGQDSHLHAWAP